MKRLKVFLVSQNSEKIIKNNLKKNVAYYDEIQ